MLIEFIDHATTDTIFTDHTGPIPRKNERVFINEELYKVRRVFYWYDTKAPVKLQRVEVSLIKL